MAKHSQRQIHWILALLLVYAPPFLLGQTVPTTVRDQAVLLVDGEFVADGLKIKAQPATGPGANMQRKENGQLVKGQLDAGDVVTAVEGKGFQDRRDFLDLMDEAYRTNKGVVTITVKDVNSGKSLDWTVRPEVLARMELPPKVGGGGGGGDAKGKASDTRDQAVLMVDGEFVRDGLKVKAQPASGPGANMNRRENGRLISGVLDAGDIVTAVEGKGFKDKREFLDLMDEAYRTNRGTVRITVKDVNNGKSLEWTVRPDVMAKYELPPKAKAALAPEKPVQCIAMQPAKARVVSTGGLGLTADTSLMWKKNELSVYFLDGKKEVHDKVMRWANVWNDHCDIKFVQVKDTKTADIRVAFRNDQGANGNWSYIGTFRPADYKIENPTLNLGDLNGQSSDTTYSELVLHEFGHAIGFIHEHQIPKNGINWDKNAVYKEYLEKYGWDKKEVDAQLFTAYSSNSLNGTQFDPKSIMMYEIPARHVLDRVAVSTRNTELSELDKRHAAWLYPKEIDPAIRPHDSRLKHTVVPPGHRFLITAASNFGLSKNGEYILNVWKGKELAHNQNLKDNTPGKTWTWYNDTKEDVTFSYVVYSKGKARIDPWRFCNESDEILSKRDAPDNGPNREDRRSIGVSSRYIWYSGPGDTIEKDGKRPIWISRQVDKMDKK